MHKLIIDFETYYDSELTLRKMNYTEYVAKADVMCLSYILDDANPLYTFGDGIGEFLATIPWDNTELICHNTLFDALVLQHNYHYEAARYADTISAARLLHPTLKKDLGRLSEALLDTFVPKDSKALAAVRGKHFHQLTVREQQTLIDYNINDVRLTKQLYDLLWPQVPQHERDLIDHTIKLWLHPTLVLDIDLAQKALDEERLETSALITQSGLAQTDIRSDAKFSAYLRSQGYEPPTKISLKKNCEIPAFAKTDAAFEVFYEDHPEIQPLLDLKRRINSNIKESRTERLISSSNVHKGRIPIAYNYCGAFTGRFSGGNSVNLQNIPKTGILREAIMAPKGYKLICCDLSQIEARLTAWFCGEEKILDIFRNKRDLYCEVASEIFGKPINKKDHPHERFCGKSAVLGLNYSMGAERFQAWCRQSGATLELDFCRTVVKLYRQNFAEIPAAWKALEQNMFLLKDSQRKSDWGNSDITYTKPGWLSNKRLPITITPNKILLPSGRTLNYGKIITGESGGYRIDGGRFLHAGLLLENIIQALSRDILGEQILRAEQIHPVVMHTHDEIVWCVPDAIAETARQQLLDIMCTPPTWGPDIPMNAEAAIGQRYSECK